MADIKKILQDTIDTAKKKKAEEDSARQEKNDSDRNKILENISGDLSQSLQPVLAELAKGSQISEQQIRNALSDALEVNMPAVDTESISNAIQTAVAEAFANLEFPEPKVNVSVPEFKMPEIKIPETKFPDKMDVGLGNYSKKSPMPVMMMSPDGKPFVFSFPTSMGGKQDFFTIKGITATVGMVAINPDGTPAGSGSVASSVSVSDIFGTVGSNVVNPDGRIKVELPTGSSGITDTEIRASSLPVAQASGAIWSMFITGASGTIATSILNGDGNTLDPRDRNWTITESLNVNQVSGAIYSVSMSDVFATTTASTVVNPDNQVKVVLPTYTQPISITDIYATTSASTVVNPDNRVRVELPATTITGITNSTAVTLLNGDGTSKDSFNISTVTSITNTIATANVDSSGVQYSGSNPVPVTLISSATQNINMVGGGNDSIFTYMARTTNPTAVTDGADVRPKADKLGRPITRPIQVRDLILTAYATATTGLETTILGAQAGFFTDCIMLSATNGSTAAVQVDIRSTLAGNIVHTFYLPASTGPVGWSPTVPWPQDNQGNAWTFDTAGADVSNTSIYISGLFSKEV